MIQIISYFITVVFIIISEKFIRKPGQSKSITINNILDKNSLFYILSILSILIITPLLNYFHIGVFSNQLIGLVGIATLITGLLIRTFSMNTLGKYYTRAIFISEKQVLVDSGLYKYVRHPGYTGTIIAAIGFGLAQNNWIILILIVILIVCLYYVRISKEEKILTQTFGEKYIKYMARTKRLVPFMW